MAFGIAREKSGRFQGRLIQQLNVVTRSPEAFTPLPSASMAILSAWGSSGVGLLVFFPPLGGDHLLEGCLDQNRRPKGEEEGTGFLCLPLESRKLSRNTSRSLLSSLWSELLYMPFSQTYKRVRIP